MRYACRALRGVTVRPTPEQGLPAAGAFVLALAKGGFERPRGLYGNVPESRGVRILPGSMEGRRGSFQVIVERRLFGRRVARSGIHSPGKEHWAAL
jgi:hypothetical protein